MALKPGDIANFQMLLKAAKRGDLALVESKDAATGAYRALVCAMSTDQQGFTNVVPFGHLADGNPYEMYKDPTEE